MQTHALAYEIHSLAEYRKTLGTDVTVKHWGSITVDDLVRAGYCDKNMAVRLTAFNSVPEFGLDGLTIAENVYHGIQCKYRDPSKCTCLDVGCLGTALFATLRMRDHNPASKLVVLSTVPFGKNAALFCPTNIIERHVIPPGLPSPTPVVKTLWKHQVEALAALKGITSGNHTLAMPCGSGKTEVFINYIKDKRAVVVAPLRALADQLANRAPGGKIRVFVDHAGTTERDQVAAAWATRRGTIFTTIKSWNLIVADVVREDRPDVVVFDEAHHLTARCLNLSTAPINLLVTATPLKHVEAVKGGDNNDMDVDESSTDGDNTNDEEGNAMATAPIAYHYSIKDGIADGVICDYRLYLPMNVAVDDVDSAHAKARFIMDGIRRTGARACLILDSRWEKVNAVLDQCRVIQEREWGDLLTIRIDTIRGETQNRPDVLRAFQDVEDRSVVSLLGSVNIMREGIDVPRCDAVFIGDPSMNSIRFVQAMSRSTRKDLLKPDKVASIMAWWPVRDDVPGFLRRLSKEDPEFTRKMRAFNPKTLDVLPGQFDAQLALENDWVEDVARLSAIRCATSHEKTFDKVEVVCAEYLVRGTWDYTRDDRFDDGTSKYHFVIDKRKRGRKGKDAAVIARFLEIDPFFCNPMEPKVRRLIEWIRANHGRFPPSGLCIGNDQWAIGEFAYNVRKAGYSLTEDQRRRINEACPGFFDMTERERKIDRLIDLLVKNGGHVPKQTGYMDDTDTIHTSRVEGAWHIGRFVTNLKEDVKEGKFVMNKHQHERLLAACPDFFKSVKRGRNVPDTKKASAVIEWVRQNPAFTQIKGVTITIEGEEHALYSTLNNMRLRLRKAREVAADQRTANQRDTCSAYEMIREASGRLTEVFDVPYMPNKRTKTEE